MATGELLGRILCPYCKKVEMRINKDRNGKPFGFCDRRCRGQLRVGGDEVRESDFLEAYPHIAEALAKTNSTATATTTGTGDTPAPGKRETPPGPDPVPPEPPRRRSLLEEALAAKG